MKLVAEVLAWQPEMVSIRRDIHAHPELGYEEERTSERVASLLEEWGIEVHRRVGITGVVGVIRGRRDNGRALGLRADMDALPMQEDNKFEHASRNAGKMHACGHDGHTTMLLSAARYLAGQRDFDGTVYLIFQPAEEGLIGAGKMIEDGLFRRFEMQAVFGMHNWPELPVGTFAVHDGPVMASSNYFQVHITGKGAHAAMPHLGHDPLAAAVQLAQSLQTIVTRNLNPLEPVALSITQLHAGSADNVVPDQAQLRGTVRVFSSEAQQLVHKRLQELTQGICQAMGCTAELHFKTNYPPTINHPEEANFSASVLSDMLGQKNVVRNLKPTMGGEDFALMLEQKPGCYVWIGNGMGDHRLSGHGGGPCMLHNPSYDFNDELIPIGASYWIQLARQWLAARP